MNMKKNHLPNLTLRLEEMALFNDVLSTISPHVLGEFMAMMHHKFKAVDQQTDTTYEQELQLFIHWLDNQEN